MTGLTKARPVLAISPHLDDAVMAVGATMAALADAGREVVVCTVFAGVPRAPFSPVAEGFHADCGLGDDAVVRRRDEDLTALSIIGAEPVHLPHLDAIYRRHGDGWLCTAPRSMFDPALPANDVVHEAVTADIAQLVHDVRPAAVWTCAAIGGHVDHRLTRDAVHEAGRRGGWTPVLWEGLPYAIGLDAPINVLLRPASVEHAHLERKLAAIEKYPSQIAMLWPDGEDWRAEFVEHARSRAEIGAPEVLWRSDHSAAMAAPQAEPRKVDHE